MWRVRQLWERIQKKEADGGYLRVFLLNFLLAALSFLPMLLKGNGIFLLCNDFNEQQIPFHMLANDAVKGGNVFWNWSIDLGSNFTGALGFYVLGSPFAWLSFLFPSKWYPYVTGWLYMAKYAVAAVTAYGYLGRFTQRKYAALGGTLYAFSGFQAVNLIFHHFHDAVAFFPLLLIGYEKLAREGKRGALALGVCVNALVNYYFFIQEVLFLFLYFLCREGIRLWKNRKLIGNCFLEGILGTGMAGILFIPNIVFTMDNPRLSHMLPMKNWIYRGNRDYLQMVRTLLFPGELMNAQSCIKEYDWSSWSFYLPMISLSLVLCYLIKRRKDWLSKLILLCIAATGIPLFNSYFGLFSDTNYHRWLFMPILMMSLASVRVLENREEFPIKRVCALQAAFMALLVAGSFWWSTHRFPLINHPGVYLLWSGTGLAGVLLTLLFSLGKGKTKGWFLRMSGGILLFSVFTTAHTAWLYGEGADRSARDYYDRILAFREFANPDDRYRIASSDNTLLMAASLPGTGSFTSMVNGSIYEFYEKLGLQRYVFTPEGPDGLKELMGGKYYVTAHTEEGDRVIQSAGRDRVYFLCEGEEAVPIGSSYDYYIRESVFERIPPRLRAVAMLKCIVVPDEKVKTVSSLLTEYDGIQAGELREGKREEFVRERYRQASTQFHKRQTGFEAVIETDREKYAFFSVPFDRGFRAYVNGKEVEILKTNGMMAVPLEAGRNEIRFRYRDIPLLLGALCTLISFVLWGLVRRSHFHCP